jgi:hypothetical protein
MLYALKYAIIFFYFKCIIIMCENNLLFYKNFKNLKKIVFILLKVVVSFLHGFFNGSIK